VSHRPELILVLNCGSSSIKFALFEAGVEPLPRQAEWSGKVSGIGGSKPAYRDSADTAEQLAADEPQPYHAALERIRAHVLARLAGRGLRAVAHRVVHGGSKYSAPTLVNAAVLADLKSFIPLAPLHQPFALEAIEVLLAELPRLPQVACFDTAFPATASTACPTNTWRRCCRSASAPWRTGASSSPTWAAAPACAPCRTCTASPRRWAFPRWRG
jgi:acetate kinase